MEHVFDHGQFEIKNLPYLRPTLVSISNYNTKYPIGKSIFAVNLPLKLFPATIANADIGSLKSLHKFL